MTISPINIINENNVEFYLHGKSYTVNTDENTIVENEEISNNVLALAWAQENFQFTNESITWFHGSSRISYNVTESKFYLNSSEILSENIANYLLTAGVIRYDETSIAENLQNAANNIDKFINLDFVNTVNERGNLVDIMKLGNNVYVSRINETSKIYNFFKASSANAALEFVTEKTGVDATDFLSDLLEGEAAKRSNILKSISEKEDLIYFLKDQRGLLAEADRSIEEIRMADALIEGEIERFENEIKELKATL